MKQWSTCLQAFQWSITTLWFDSVEIFYSTASSRCTSPFGADPLWIWFLFPLVTILVGIETAFTDRSSESEKLCIRRSKQNRTRNVWHLEGDTNSTDKLSCLYIYLNSSPSFTHLHLKMLQALRACACCQNEQKLQQYQETRKRIKGGGLACCLLPESSDRDAGLEQRCSKCTTRLNIWSGHVVTGCRLCTLQQQQ